MKPPIPVTLPCCSAVVKATHRRSKQQERPRNHRCPSCGREFRIDLRTNQTPPVVAAA